MVWTSWDSTHDTNSWTEFKLIIGACIYILKFNEESIIHRAILIAERNHYLLACTILICKVLRVLLCFVVCILLRDSRTKHVCGYAYVHCNGGCVRGAIIFTVIAAKIITVIHGTAGSHLVCFVLAVGIYISLS